MDDRLERTIGEIETYFQLLDEDPGLIDELQVEMLNFSRFVEEQEIKNYVKEKLSKHEYPRDIEFVDDLPKTPKGNIKKQELLERSIHRIQNKG